MPSTNNARYAPACSKLQSSLKLLYGQGNNCCTFPKSPTGLHSRIVGDWLRLQLAATKDYEATLGIVQSAFTGLQTWTGPHSEWPRIPRFGPPNSQ